MGVKSGIKSEDGNERQADEDLEGGLCEDTIQIGFCFAPRLNTVQQD
jgi:hypothetical protein